MWYQVSLLKIVCCCRSLKTDHLKWFWGRNNIVLSDLRYYNTTMHINKMIIQMIQYIKT